MGHLEAHLNPTHKPSLLSKKPPATPPAAPSPLTTASTPQTKMNTQTNTYTYPGTAAPRQTAGWVGGGARLLWLVAGWVGCRLDHVTPATLNKGRGRGMGATSGHRRGKVRRGVCRLWPEHGVVGMTKAPLPFGGGASVGALVRGWLSSLCWHE